MQIRTLVPMVATLAMALVGACQPQTTGGPSQPTTSGASSAPAGGTPAFMLTEQVQAVGGPKRTVSVGKAPTPSQYSIRSRFSDTCLSGFLLAGSYQPSCSIMRPPRGTRLSIAPIRKKLRWRRPMRFSLNLTATGILQLARPP